MNTIDFVRTDISDMACHTGVTFIVDIRVANECTDLPNDLSGYTAQIFVYDEIESNEIVTIAGQIVAPETGEIHFELTADQTSLLDEGLYSYQMEITSSGGVVYRIAQGSFEVSP